MFGFGKKRGKAQQDDGPGRLRQGLGRTRGRLGVLGGLLTAGGTVDGPLLEDVEALLLSADVGPEACDEIIGGLKERLGRRPAEPAVFMAELRRELEAILAPCSAPLQLPAQLKRSAAVKSTAARTGAAAEAKAPFVILVVGVNGVGKTTTIGKLAARFQQQGRTVMLAAGDTFRAAAVEQLQAWGSRHQVPVVAQGAGADSASVIYDGYQSARAKGMDVLIADTAGRLHTQGGLMAELEKVVRVLRKQGAHLPDETLLVLDATTGQNALSQAESFRHAVPLSGLVLTKLDGTAKGGVVFALAKRFGLPIRFVGVGEKAADLRPFNAAEFVSALF